MGAERPEGDPEVRPGDVTLNVARPGGLLRVNVWNFLTQARYAFSVFGE